MSRCRRALACLVASATLVVAPLAVAAPPPEEAALPSWDTQPSLDPEPAPTAVLEPIPPDGSGSTAVGSMLLGGGTILGVSSGVLIFRDPDEVGLWIAGAVLSGLALATGTGLLISGAVKRKHYQPWRLQHDPPPQGTGMFAGGTLALSAGAFGMLLGGVSLRLQDGDDLPYGQVVLSLGAASVVTGIVLLAAGAKRGRAFNAWNDARLLPTLGFARDRQLQTAGPTFGVAGRF